MNEVKSQVLVDKSATGKVRPWALHKLHSQYIAMAYEEVDPRKAERMRDCANYLSFWRKEDGSMKLHDARFCRVRLCPVCQWRRSLKTYAQMSQVLDIAKSDGYRFIFLTLTMRNCDAQELSGELTHILQAFNRLMKYKDVRKAVKGYYRGCEVKHSLSRDDYHPHLHCVLAVNESYFTNRTYISHAKWVALWQKALKVEYTPIVNIKKCYGGNKSIAEACKYAVKADDVINYDDWDMTVETLRILDNALEKRRFIGLGGVIKDIHKKLHLDDMEDGDLVHTTEQEQGEATKEEIIYFWNGYSQYEK
jgi:plasmid rolling circle replication initiator protein Rep